MSSVQQIQEQVTEIVGSAEPEIEVLLVERAGGTLRVFIDFPGGVSLDHCERVTHALADLRDDYSLEVSSPGPERPLTRPEHFIRYSGRKAKLKLVEPVTEDDRRTISGEILEADNDRLVLLADGEQVEVSYGAIGRANLIAA